MISKVLEVNKGPKLDAFIGYGLGNTQFFAAASLDPQWFDDNVNMFIAWAPFVEMHRQIWFVPLIVSWVENLPRWFRQVFGLWSFEEAREARMQKAINCEYNLGWCIFWQVFAMNYNINSLERLPMVYAHENMGQSWKVYEHMQQIAFWQKF